MKQYLFTIEIEGMIGDISLNDDGVFEISHRGMNIVPSTNSWEDIAQYISLPNHVSYWKIIGKSKLLDTLLPDEPSLKEVPIYQRLERPTE